MPVRAFPWQRIIQEEGRCLPLLPLVEVLDGPMPPCTPPHANPLPRQLVLAGARILLVHPQLVAVTLASGCQALSLALALGLVGARPGQLGLLHAHVERVRRTR